MLTWQEWPLGEQGVPDAIGNWDKVTRRVVKGKDLSVVLWRSGGSQGEREVWHRYSVADMVVTCKGADKIWF